MTSKVALTGNEAVAQAMRQINPDVVAAYPITPQTALVQTFSQFVADGVVDTEYVTVESEHSALSATVGASAAGARAMTATAANGLALMWEILYIASGTRLPIVMPVINRALSGPINIHCDHSDTMGARDSGWIQIYAENCQEAYDNAIQAIRISEHPDVMLPTMVNMDGFITSHAVESLEILADQDVKGFVGDYKPENYLLNTDKPIAVGPLDLQDFYFEHKKQQADAILKAKDVILDVAKEYKDLTGREYSFFEEYRLEDAEVGIVALSSTAGTAKAAVDNLRDKGIKAGLLKIRVFRPFPADEIAEALSNLKAVAIMDRAESFSANGGPVFAEVKAALYDNRVVNQPDTKAVNYIFGLGGRDIKVDEIEGVFADLVAIVEKGEIKNKITHLGVRV